MLPLVASGARLYPAPMYGVVSTAESARLRDATERPSTEMGVGGGYSGAGIYGSAYEHNRRLQANPDRIAAFRRAMTHWSVQSGVTAWRGLCEIATWSVTAADDSPQAAQYAAHIRACLGIGAQSPLGTEWQVVLRQLLQAHLEGFAVWEMVPVQVGGVWYTPLLPRDATSIARWIVDGDGRLAAVEQRPTAGYGTFRIIPASQLLVYVCGAVAHDDYSGEGMLRSVEPLYRDVVTLQQQLIAGVRRWATPTPVARLLPDVSRQFGNPETPAFVQAELEKYQQTLQLYISHDQSYLMVPPWIELATFGGELGNLAEVQAIIDARDRQILSVASAQWLMLGTANASGSYSLSETQMSAAHDAAQAVDDDICRGMQSYIGRAVRWQFGPNVPDALMPRMKAAGLASEAFVRYLSVLPSLVSADLLRPDDAVRDAVRAAVEMPAEDPSARPRGQRVRPAAIPPSGILTPSAVVGQG